ncbi:cobalamin biosynthesis protein [Williamsia sp. SKLECPSW1]
MRGRRGTARAVGIALGVAADRAFGDPARWHPVAGMGTVAAAVERRIYADRRAAGVAYTGICVGGVVAVAAAVDRAGPVTTAVTTAAATWAALGGTTLTGVVAELGDRVDRDDLDGARDLVPSLCGRDPRSLDGPGMIRAAVESLAENTSDATVGPLVWAAVAGAPGALGYRMVNTLDAMVGYRSPRHRRFGWASARLDDVANLVPARVTGLVVIALGPDRRGAVAAWRRDASGHPSPNAGVVEATFAGALGTGLGGITVYPHGVEDRPRLGDGPPPTITDLRRAVVLSRRVQAVVAVLACGAAVVLGEGISRRSGR